MFSVIVPPNAPPETRRSHKKSRAGCRNCKERKLKCDEVKPVCRNCERHFMNIEACDYRPRLPRRPDTTCPLAAAPPRSAPESSNERLSSSSSSESGSDSDWRLALPTSLRAERLDPFMTHPPTQVKGVDILMKYYLKTTVFVGFPWQPASPTNPTTNFYVPLVLSDVVLFHATLQLSAWRLGQRARALQRIAVNFAHISAECIRLLRDRVENEGGGVAGSDQTISAVATLAAIEHERGNTKMIRMHLSGLKRMLSIRGGLNAIRSSNAMVANSVFWVCAVAMYEVPYPSLDPQLPAFIPGEHGLGIPVVSIFQDFGPEHVDPTPPLDLVALGVSPSIAVVVRSIQHVSQLVPTSAAYPTASTSLVILTRICTLLSHLLSLPQIRGSQATDLPHSALLSESIRFATLLHVFTPWRGLPPDGTLTINHLLHQLMTTLTEVLQSGSFRSSTSLLWVLSVGGVSAVNMPERVWFASHLVEMTAEMNIGRWETMKSHVCRVIWHERLCENSHRKLWEEVMAKRRELEEG